MSDNAINYCAKNNFFNAGQNNDRLIAIINHHIMEPAQDICHIHVYARAQRWVPKSKHTNKYYTGQWKGRLRVTRLCMCMWDGLTCRLST